MFHFFVFSKFENFKLVLLSDWQKALSSQHRFEIASWRNYFCDYFMVMIFQMVFIHLKISSFLVHYDNQGFPINCISHLYDSY